MDKNQDLPELMTEMLIKQDRTNEILEQFMAVSVKQWEQQTKFNERFFDKLEKLERILEKLILLEDRIKHLEDLEERVSKIESLLRAS
ncbi:MAG: hypothetical protein JSU01_00065 [Bacteroidetes bacterium]|nr:hypothetical protein [Bacteroidota bacterium]